MLRFVWSQFRHRKGRTAALGVGILVAALSFVLLTSAVSTSRLRVVGAVSESFRPAYDILVRPPGSFTSLERDEGLVQNNYLSGIFGGISFRQYRELLRIPGIEVAAPIANVGYVLPFEFVPIIIDRFLSDDPVQLYRLRLSWVAHDGHSRYPDSDLYVYYTRANRFAPAPREPGGIREVSREGRFPVCTGFIVSQPEPFDPAEAFAPKGDDGMMCFSERTPSVQGGVIDYGPLPAGDVGAVSTAFFPILVAAIDPVQEARLVGLDESLVSGRFLRTDERPVVVRRGRGARYLVVPFLASTRTYVDETLRVAVERLAAAPSGSVRRRLSSQREAYRFVSELPGRTVGTLSYPIGPMYERLAENLSVPPRRLEISYNGYWTASSVAYQVASPDRLAPLPVGNTEEVFASSYYGAGWAPQENRDVQFRRLVAHQASTDFLSGGILGTPAIRVVGRFDPERLPGFSPLSRVPLETYYPPQAVPADPASRAALGDGPLLPTMNLGDYVSQPPLMLTTLDGLRAFGDPEFFEGADPRTPISVVRVRVAGVRGPDRVSRERIRVVAEQIRERTGLAVDITAGSSPRPLFVELPPGKFGRPALLVREGWVEKGVAVAFLDAVDRKSLALFLLILVVTGLFLANASFASVRARRREVGTLLCLGWDRRRIFTATLGEVLLVGGVAGVIGSAIAVAAVAIFDLQMSLPRTLLVGPIAVALAAVAGGIPAWRASRMVPLDAVRPGVLARGSSRPARTVLRMAIRNLLRVPSRTLLGAGGLFIGVGALTILLAVNLAFQGVLVGTLLGGFISVQVRGVDLASVLLAMALAGLSVADVIVLNLRERAPELVTLRAAGWRDRHIGRLVAVEGVAMGAAGSLAGAVFGIVLAGLVGGIDARVLAAGLAGALGGTAVALVGSLVPATLASRMTPPAVLAEE